MYVTTTHYLCMNDRCTVVKFSRVHGYNTHSRSFVNLHENNTWATLLLVINC